MESMFKLLYLKLRQHPQLGDLELFFVEDQEVNNIEKPYTSIVIGPNGSGKSYILRAIIEILKEFSQLKDGTIDQIPSSWNVQLRYKYDSDVYEIFTKAFATVDRNKKLKRDYIFLKNRPPNVSLYDTTKKVTIPLEIKTGFEITINELKLPAKILASSVFLNDRFPFADSDSGDFYQYLGVRRTASMASTKTFARKTVQYLYEASIDEGFNQSLKDILQFLGFEAFFTITYNKRYSKLFFNGKLTNQRFRDFYERWWELKEFGVNRNRNNAPWGEYYYQIISKNNPSRINDIVNFLNKIGNFYLKLGPQFSSPKRFIVDLFNFGFDKQDLQIIDDLEKLSILTLDEIKIIKKTNQISLEDTSSGEYHLILNFLGIFAKIQSKSLILIDEPEISLHPNWQMRYITFLKNVFSKFSDCHFIICTHSHFLVSDLEGSTSSIISLSRNVQTALIEAELLKKDTYAWSAEEVLLKVFKVPTTRNFYIADKLGEILELVSKSNRDDNLIKTKVEELVALNIQNLSNEDPLKPVVNKLLQKYG